MVKEHNQFFVFLMGLTDLIVTAAAWLLCFYIRFHSQWFEYQEVRPPSLEYIYDVIVVTLLLTLLIFSRLGMYKPHRLQGLAATMVEIIRACVVVWSLEVVVSHFLQSAPVSRKLQVMFLVLWPTMMIASRGAARMFLRHVRSQGRNTRTAAIVGSGRVGQKLLHTLRRQPWTGYDIEYFIEDHRIGETFLGVPVRGPIKNVDKILRDEPVDAVFITVSNGNRKKLDEILGRISTEMVDVNIVPDTLSYHFLRHRVQQVGSMQVVNLTHSPQSGWPAAAKRIFDILFSAVALTLLLPFMIIIAIAIKLTSRGPVFYLQRRASLGGREFDIIKFRSMIPHSERADDVLGPPKGDPRITPVGKILRKLSLDELPQLINVLLGDMSLVGPRPERPEFIERFSRQIPRYMLRHHVKAGITGWAQVKGFRGRSSLRKRIQYDLDYVMRWSFTFDLWILLLTIFRGFYNPND